MLVPNDWHGLEALLLGGQPSTMSGQNDIVFVGDDWAQKAKLSHSLR
jgi:hypothetical protein